MLNAHRHAPYFIQKNPSVIGQHVEKVKSMEENGPYISH